MIKAKGITSPQQKEATHLHTAGRKLQKVYETLPEPTGLAEDADVYNKAIAKLDRYFAGNINQPFERHKSRSMRQETAESIAHFVSRLMRQADFCGFGGTRGNQVRDQLIEGCLSTKLRLKLLKKGKDLTLDVALKMSSCHESVTQQANEMQLDNVHKIDINKVVVSRRGTNRVAPLTAGSPTKQEMRKTVGNAEKKAIYPKMIAVRREKKSAESVVLLDTSLKCAEVKIPIKIESSA